MFKSLMFAAPAALCIAMPAAAQSVDSAVETASTSLQVNLHDLARAGGQERLEARIAVVARRLCWSGGRTLADRNSETQCVARAMASARPQVERAVALARTDRRFADVTVRTGG